MTRAGRNLRRGRIYRYVVPVAGGLSMVSGTSKIAHQSAAAGILIGTSLLGFASTAPAADGSDVPMGAGAPSPAHNFEGGLAVTAALGRGAWLFGGAEFGARILQRVSLTAFFDAPLAHDPMEADCGDVYCPTSEYKIGARARFHIMPSFVIDPWVGLAGAARIDAGTPTKVALDAEGSVGADVRLGQVAFGPFGFVNQQLSRSDWPSGWKGQVGLGIRGSIDF